eukprot:7255946-Pyramimonas_sp.AAC.1
MHLHTGQPQDRGDQRERQADLPADGGRHGWAGHARRIVESVTEREDERAGGPGMDPGRDQSERDMRSGEGEREREREGGRGRESIHSNEGAEERMTHASWAHPRTQRERERER